MNYKKPQSTIVHGGAGIYPLTTADQVILADGSRLEKDGKINVDTATNSAKLGGKAPEYYLQPRNLLDNSDFRNPVNQRGKTSYNEPGYTIDRWENEGIHDLNIVSGGIHLTCNSTLRLFIQRLSDEAWNTLKGKVFTVAACTDDGSIYVSTGTFPEGTGNLDSYQAGLGSSGYMINLYKGDNDRPMVRIFSVDQGSKVTLQWAALYEGSYTADTLPPYVPKGYAAEFAECRRYYKRFTSPNSSIICAGYVTDSTKRIYINALDNYPMRIGKPSCSFSGNITVRGINGYIAQDYSDVVIKVYANATGCISMIEIARGDSATWNATNNTPLFVTINANSVFELIADL